MSEQEKFLVIEKHDKEYPLLLSQIPDPPERIWLRGFSDFENPAIAIVGTRKPTAYGKEAANYFSSALSEIGFTIVSGLAFGIDTIAHEAALKSGGKTIAVLGSGVDQITPESNRRLGEMIIKQGALVSEFPPGTPAYPTNFPRRNRVISGISLGVLVIEAGKESGALITAKYALLQGREVFALPGQIFSPSSEGTNQLIQEGAKLVAKPEDILEEFNHLQLPLLTKSDAKIKSLGEESKLIMDILKNQSPILPEELAIKANISIVDTQRFLTKLEMVNLIRRLDDGSYIISNH